MLSGEEWRGVRLYNIYYLQFFYFGFYLVCGSSLIYKILTMIDSQTEHLY